jgi:hypothetical protein
LVSDRTKGEKVVVDILKFDSFVEFELVTKISDPRGFLKPHVLLNASIIKIIATRVAKQSLKKFNTK